MLSIRERQVSLPSQESVGMHLRAVEVEQEETSWQRSSSGSYETGGLCRNDELAEILCFLDEHIQLQKVTSLSCLWHPFMSGGAMFRLCLPSLFLSAGTLLAGPLLGQLLTFSQPVKSTNFHVSEQK